MEISLALVEEAVRRGACAKRCHRRMVGVSVFALVQSDLLWIQQHMADVASQLNDGVDLSLYAENGSGSGYGYGYGDGDGSGSGSGSGFGSAYGSGYGDGSGSGSGSGYGFDCGYGFDYGDGSGSGSGYRYG